MPSANPNNVINQHGFVCNGATSTLTDIGAKVNPSAINDSGLIVGSYTPSGKSFAVSFQGTSTPTPIALSSPYIPIIALGVNNSGAIVGDAIVPVANDAPIGVGYVLNGASQTILPSLGGGGTVARGINSTGQVVGDSQLFYDPTVTLDPTFHAFVTYAAETQMTDLGTLGGKDSYAVAINASGEVIRNPGKKFAGVASCRGVCDDRASKEGLTRCISNPITR